MLVVWVFLSVVVLVVMATLNLLSVWLALSLLRFRRPSRMPMLSILLFFTSRIRHSRCSRDWSSDVCSSDLHGLKRRLVAFELALKVSFVARRSLAFADSRVFCPHRGVIGLVDQAQQERAEAVGFALWRFDAVTAQPADKEQDRHLESSVPRVGDESA